MKNVFFHIHIWKTAGTSFFNICRENFGSGFHRDKMLIQDWFLSKQQIRWIVEYHDWIRCYSCHMLSGELPFDMKETKVIGIAFVRNPVNRFVSSYNFQRGDVYRGGNAKIYDFDNFYAKALIEVDNPMWRNGQTFILGGSRTELGIDTILRRLNKGQIVLLPMERFDESCILLERLFPNDFRDCSYAPYNFSKRAVTISERQRSEISKYMALDFKLFNLANKFLDANLDRLFTNSTIRQQYIDDFLVRCKLKKRRKRITHMVVRIEKKINYGLQRVAQLF